MTGRPWRGPRGPPSGRFAPSLGASCATVPIIGPGRNDEQPDSPAGLVSRPAGRADAAVLGRRGLDVEPGARLILQLGRFAGLRRAEVAAVHTRHVEGGWLRVEGKGGHVRRVPLHPVLLEQLQRAPAGWVFPALFGQHLTADHVGRLASRALPDGWTLHTCRHRAGTDMYAVRRDIRAVQEILGHASVRTTQLYTQVEDDALLAAVMGIVA